MAFDGCSGEGSTVALALNSLTLTLSLDYYPGPYQLSRGLLEIDAKQWQSLPD